MRINKKKRKFDNFCHTAAQNIKEMFESVGMCVGYLNYWTELVNVYISHASSGYYSFICELNFSKPIQYRHVVVEVLDSNGTRSEKGKKRRKWQSSSLVIVTQKNNNSMTPKYHDLCSYLHICTYSYTIFIGGYCSQFYQNVIINVCSREKKNKHARTQPSILYETT